MAEAAAPNTPPTFKLVLVGDGGTGKVRGQPSYTHFDCNIISADVGLTEFLHRLHL